MRFPYQIPMHPQFGDMEFRSLRVVCWIHAKVRRIFSGPAPPEDRDHDDGFKVFKELADKTASAKHSQLFIGSN
jgi:hypothetical protein